MDIHPYEVLLFLTEAYALKRSEIHRLLGISSSQQHPSTDLVFPFVRRAFRYTDKFSTRTMRPAGPAQGLAINDRSVKRFKALGLVPLAPVIARPTSNSVLKRVHEAIRWLDQSLVDKDPSAAVVKTCIGFESLFGFDKSEPLRQSIGDRGAFLLARSADDRAALARLLRDFYDLRSAIVHGGSKKRAWTEQAQQQLDRMLLVSAISVAALSDTHRNVEQLRAFFDGLKWASSPNILPNPVARSLLKRVCTVASTTAG